MQIIPRHFQRAAHALVTATTLTLTLVAPALATSPAARADRPTLEQFLRIRAPGTPVMLPDGSVLMRDWPEGVWQLFHVAPKSVAGAPSFKPADATTTRLTSFPDGLARFSVAPDGSRVVLMHSAGGNENTQLTLLELKGLPGGTPSTRPILDAPRVQADVNCWLPDSSGIIFSANLDSPTDFHLYRYDFTGPQAGQTTKVLARPGSWSARSVTADGSRLLVEEFKSASNSSCFEFNARTGDLRDLTVRATPGANAAGHWVGYLPGETRALATSDARDGVIRIFSLDLKSGTPTEPLPALARHDAEVAILNDDASLLAVSTNEDGYGVPHVFDTRDFHALAFPKTDKGVIGGTDFRGETLLWSTGRSLSWSNSNARDCGAGFVTTYPAESASAPVTHQVSYPETAGVNLSTFPLPDLVRYKAFDGREIPAFVFLPPEHVKGTPVPFIVLYHGGPEGQHRPVFSALQQFLLSEGFGVMLPNVRGSAGYGREFLMLDDYKNRWDSVRDGVDAAEWLVAQGLASPGKIATMGGSYGGYMSVACLVEDQERVDAGKRAQRLFGAGVNIVGIVNLKTFLEKTAGYRRKLREAEYGPLTDPEFLLSVSSMTRIDKLKVPMFIAHGFNDPRVPVEEAMQLAVALKDRGTPVHLFVAPDEGHGFQKLENRAYFYSRVAPFLRESLR
ncbi:MAG: prolyl oligopeptidase family serine peptidase [Phycisphaerales bacterium]